jgi:hypothetical protein
MCTVSFIPNSRGFYVAMNRDEKCGRAAALPPAIVDLAKGRVRPSGGLEAARAIFPSEPSGGTWIAANDAGVCLALINWHRIEREPKGEIVSRGEVIRALVGKCSSGEIAETVTALPLRKLRPFRLIAIVPAEKIVVEWRWNLERLIARKHGWRRQHWFSSGLDERRAELERAKVCATAGVTPGYNLGALRRLHRSHAPERGPFSICMHRADAETVSYTEVAVTPTRLTMRYKAGSPCSATLADTITLRIQKRCEDARHSKALRANVSRKLSECDASSHRF